MSISSELRTVSDVDAGEASVASADAASAKLPKLSLILVSPDRADLPRRTIEHVCRQTIASDIELILVAPSVQCGAEVKQCLAALHSHRILQSPTGVYSHGQQFALGVAEATAPYVAVGEDHADPAPDWAEQLVRAFETSTHTGIAVAVYNANPRTALSWGSLLTGYLNWVGPVSAGPMNHLPASHAAYRREALLGYESDLAEAMERDGTLQSDLRDAGHTFWLEPGARIYHRNPSLWRSAFRAQYDIGQYMAARRAARERWSRGRKVVELARLPFNGAYRFAKVFKRLAARRYRITPKIIAGVGVTLVFDVVGRAAGLVFGIGDSARRIYEFEFDRDQHMHPDERVRDAMAANYPEHAQQTATEAA